MESEERKERDKGGEGESEKSAFIKRDETQKIMHNPSAKRAAEKKKRGEKDCRIARTEFNLRTLPLFDTDLRVAK